MHNGLTWPQICKVCLITNNHDKYCIMQIASFIQQTIITVYTTNSVMAFQLVHSYLQFHCQILPLTLILNCWVFCSNIFYSFCLFVPSIWNDVTNRKYDTSFLSPSETKWLNWLCYTLQQNAFIKLVKILTRKSSGKRSPSFNKRNLREL